MKRGPRSSTPTRRDLLPALALLALLVVLAVLQYRWTGQLSRAEGVRLQANLARTVADFSHEFDREISRAVAVLGFGENPVDADLPRRLEGWQQRATYPEIVDDVLVVDMPHDGPRSIRRFDPTTGIATPIELDALLGLDPLLERVDEWHLRHRRRGPRPSIIVAEPMALVVPQSGSHGRSDGPHDHHYVVVRLDGRSVEQHMLPELVTTYFDTETGYRVRVQADDRVLLALNASDPTTSDAEPDVRMPLFGIVPFRELRELTRAAEDESKEADAPGADSTGSKPPSVGRDTRDGIWTVGVTHPSGSVADAVAGQRLRNLALSFAVLLLLGASVGLTLRSARRERDLAERQMEFVAGVSHELRTPLAVICSAGQNLADGVATDAERIQRYGDVIRREGRRLTEMVEQVLDLARARADRNRHAHETIDVAATIQAALADCSALIEDEHVRLDTTIPEPLPPVRGERRALRQAVANLVTNAIRHTDGRWVGIEAGATGDRPGDTVFVAIEDRGPGIEPSERERLFEPFYRGRAAARVHGSGLGLSLVQQFATAHKGSVSIEDAAGGGSRFVIRLPVAPPEATQPGHEARTESTGRA